MKYSTVVGRSCVRSGTIRNIDNTGFKRIGKGWTDSDDHRDIYLSTLNRRLWGWVVRLVHQLRRLPKPKIPSRSRLHPRDSIPCTGAV